MNRWLAWLPWLLVALTAVAISTPLWGQPLPYGDDIRLHYYRIPQLLALWQDGLLYSRWLPYLNAGYGSPLFNFYPPFTAYGLTALYWLVGQNGTIALAFFFILALLCTAVAMFLLGRALYGTMGGLLAAILYSWSPHLLYQTYARGSISNAWAMALFPLSAWALIRLGQRPSTRYFLLASLSIALLLLSHTAASLLFLLTLLPFVATAVYQPDQPLSHNGRIAARLLLAVALGLGLSAFSWLPSLSEIGQTRYALEAGKVDFSHHFADAFRWPDPTLAQAHNPGLPKTPGFSQMTLGLLALLAALRYRASNKLALPTAVAASIGLAGLFGAISLSEPLWQLLSPLRSLQFPWRLLDIPAFYLPLAAGFLCWPKPTTAVPRWLCPTLLATAVCLAFANMLPTLYPPRIQQLPPQPTLADATAVQQQLGIYGLTAWGEYSNAAIQQWPSLPFAGAESAPLSQKLLDPPATLTAVASTPWSAEWHSQASNPSNLTFAHHYFAGWHATLDGQPWPLQSDDNGRLQLQLPAGTHQLRVEFGRTPIRWLADLLSGLSLVGLGMLLWRKRPWPAPTLEPASPHPANRQLAGLGALLLLLLLLKWGYVDRTSNLLLLHAHDGRLPGLSQPHSQNFNDELQLLAYDLAQDGQLTLYWQALQPPHGRYTVYLTLHDAQGMPLPAIRNDAPGYMATTHWQTGQLVRDAYQIQLPESPAPAAYAISLALQEESSGQWLPLLDGDGATAVSLGWLLQPPPASDSPINQEAVFGQALRLRHADLPSSLAVGQPLSLSLVWESLTAVDRDYTVFIHLLDADGRWLTGHDAQPLAGRYPTRFWQPGQQISDERQFEPDLPPGRYQLHIGWYDLASGQRLPLQNGGDSLFLGELEIRP